LLDSVVDKQSFGAGYYRLPDARAAPDLSGNVFRGVCFDKSGHRYVFNGKWWVRKG
jgi:hypothetical protein